MLDYPCEELGCTRLSIQDGHCGTCHRHLCANHLHDPDAHACASSDADEDYINHLARTRHVRLPALAWLPTYVQFELLQEALEVLDVRGTAEALRSGRRISHCAELESRSLPAGWYNVHVPIIFDDGVKWVARIRQGGFHSGPRDIGRAILLGEIDVLRWLKDVVGAPVPKVMSGLRIDGPADYYFQEFLPGSTYEPDFHRTIAEAKLRRTITDLAQFFLRISDHPLSGIGSLYADGHGLNEWTVGPLINNICVNKERPYFPGPFNTAGEKWACIFNDYLKAIQMRSLHSTRTKLACYIYHWLRQAVLSYPPYNIPNEPTFLLHEDSKWDIMMVDEEGAIRGLIDWESASVSIGAEAFAAPFGLMNSEAIFSGDNTLSAAEVQLANTYRTLGRPDLARYVEGGKVYQRLAYICSGGDAWSEYPQLRGLGQAMGLVMPDSMEEFMELQEQKYKEELEELMSSDTAE